MRFICIQYGELEINNIPYDSRLIFKYKLTCNIIILEFYIYFVRNLFVEYL